MSNGSVSLYDVHHPHHQLPLHAAPTGHGPSLNRVGGHAGEQTSPSASDSSNVAIFHLVLLLSVSIYSRDSTGTDPQKSAFNIGGRRHSNSRLVLIRWREPVPNVRHVGITPNEA